MKELAFILISLLILLILIVLIKTSIYPFKKVNSNITSGWKMIKDDSAIKRLSGGKFLPFLPANRERSIIQHLPPLKNISKILIHLFIRIQNLSRLIPMGWYSG